MATVKQSHSQLALTVAWTLFAIPDLIWWRDLVALVSFMSVYAIIISHWTAHVAAKAKEAAEHDDGDTQPTQRLSSGAPGEREWSWPYDRGGIPDV